MRLHSKVGGSKLYLERAVLSPTGTYAAVPTSEEQLCIVTGLGTLPPTIPVVSPNVVTIGRSGVWAWSPSGKVLGQVCGSSGRARPGERPFTSRVYSVEHRQWLFEAQHRVPFLEGGYLPSPDGPLCFASDEHLAAAKFHSVFSPSQAGPVHDLLVIFETRSSDTTASFCYERIQRFCFLSGHSLLLLGDNEQRTSPMLIRLDVPAGALRIGQVSSVSITSSGALAIHGSCAIIASSRIHAFGHLLEVSLTMYDAATLAVTNVRQHSVPPGSRLPWNGGTAYISEVLCSSSTLAVNVATLAVILFSLADRNIGECIACFPARGISYSSDGLWLAAVHQYARLQCTCWHHCWQPGACEPCSSCCQCDLDGLEPASRRQHHTQSFWACRGTGVQRLAAAVNSRHRLGRLAHANGSQIIPVAKCLQTLQAAPLWLSRTRIVAEHHSTLLSAPATSLCKAWRKH